MEPLQAICRSIIKAKQQFQRMQVDIAVARDIFGYNPHKLRILQELENKGVKNVSLYRCGPFIDLCLGPHVAHTGLARALKLLSHSAIESKPTARANENNRIQRVYGISFFSEEAMRNWEAQREEALRRDHRNIGRDQQLFFFNHLSPGSAFFLPHGTRIYNRLLDLMRLEYKRRGYQEVISPLIYNKELWETSGHWQNYKENMFVLDHAEKQQKDGSNREHLECLALKPMNCPGHCLMYASQSRAYRELPLRLADFSALHR